jgi:rsbT co-antagonist protein RsbR
MESEPNPEVAEILNRVADVLLVLAGVGGGDFEARLVSDLPPEHPMSLLYQGVNEMVESLATEQKRSASYQKELEEKLATIEAQREAIRELSTPIIEVWNGILCLPVVGVMDSVRSAQMTESLLGAIVEKKAASAIIDITGIQIMDTATCASSAPSASSPGSTRRSR